jgi:hypothetical protein
MSFDFKKYIPTNFKFPKNPNLIEVEELEIG